MAIINYKSKSGPNGQSDNISGMTKRIWFCPMRDFDTIAAVDPIGAVGATLTSLVEIADDHTHQATRGFVLLYSTRDKGELTAKPVGEVDGKGTLQEGSIFYPGSDSEVLGMQRLLKNDSGIVIAELANGDKFQIGNEMFPADIEVEFGSAKNTSGVMGSTIKYTSFGSGMQKYMGALTVVA